MFTLMFYFLYMCLYVILAKVYISVKELKGMMRGKIGETI